MENGPRVRPLYWVGSSKKDLLALPEEVIDVFGYALYQAQIGKKHEQAKPLKGFGSAGVLEVVEDWQGAEASAHLSGSLHGPKLQPALHAGFLSCTYFRRRRKEAWPHLRLTWT